MNPKTKDMSESPGTAYGEIVHEVNPYDIGALPSALVSALRACTPWGHVYMQGDDTYENEIRRIKNVVGKEHDAALRPMDNRKGKQVAMSGYPTVDRLCPQHLRDALIKAMNGIGAHENKRFWTGRAFKKGYTLLPSGRLRLQLVFIGWACVRFLGWPLKGPGCCRAKSRYHEQEDREIANLKRYGCRSSEPLFGVDK